MTLFEKIYLEVRKIPKGKVSTYLDIGKKIGIKDFRIIGFALHANKNPKKIPCHRVVKSNLTLAKGYAFGGMEIQRKKLENEGIRFFKNKIIEDFVFKT